MAIITISRQIGSFGNEIAQTVAERQGYLYVDKAMLSQVLEDQGLLSLLDFDNFDEKKPSHWKALSLQKTKFIYLLRAAIFDFASRGDVVLLGRGGQALLKNIPGALHVRTIAPFAVRIQRLMEVLGCDEQTARKQLFKFDRNSAGFVRSFFDADWDDADMYDLFLDTASISVQTASSMVLAAIAAPEFKESYQNVGKRLADMALEQKSMGALVDFSGVHLAKVEATNGVVRLTGLARSFECIEWCRKTIANIQGVQDVQTNLDVSERRKI